MYVLRILKSYRPTQHIDVSRLPAEKQHLSNSIASQAQPATSSSSPYKLCMLQATKYSYKEETKSKDSYKTKTWKTFGTKW